MKLNWIVVSKLKQETFWEWEKLYTKQTLIIEEDNEVEYPNRIAIDFGWDKLDLIKEIKVFDRVEVLYSTKVSEKDWKAYNTIRWRKVNVLHKATEEDLPF